MDTDTSRLRTFLHLLPLLSILALSTTVFFYITPDELIDIIGLENAYVLMFSVAFLGGLTTFNTVPYYSALLLLASAGLNPLYIGLASACGVMVGDSFSYFIGHHGATLVPHTLKRLFWYLHSLAALHPRFFPLVCFLYGSLSPLSNDFITIPAGMARIPFFRVMIPLALGNLVFNIGLAYLAVHAFSSVSSFLMG